MHRSAFNAAAKRDGCQVRSASPQRRDIRAGIDALKSRHDRNDALGQRVLDAIGRHPGNSGFGMSAIGMDADLPTREGAGDAPRARGDPWRVMRS